MTLDERIACREKIEDVYWAHRLWPKENQGQKPARESVAPHATIAARVEESLRYETAIGELWQEALSPQAIQTEMDRQARATRDPAMLRELWAALDNEPSRVAECLVRPELAERRIKERYANDPSRHGAIRQRAALEIEASATFERWWSTRRQTTRPASPPAASYVLPTVIAGGCLYDNWTISSGLSSTTPRARYSHSAVWTGSEMIVWGGFDLDAATSFNTGGRYAPATDTWVATSTVGAPSDRHFHTAVWTGSQMIVWGGLGSRGYLNTGGRYTPASDTWLPTTTVSAPEVRFSHTAVWTGSAMIVWGGDPVINTGGRYDPVSDSWVATTTTGAPGPRLDHTAVWTGTEMIVWGGGTSNLTNSPATDSWVATGIQGALSERAHHTSVWTGSEMIVWGGADGLGFLASGGRYAPATDSWVPTSMTKAPDARTLHTAIWTGTEMVVWGGSNGSGDLNTGGRYRPATDAWLATDPGSAPVAREQHTAVWTGTEMIVWGGSSFGLPLQSGGRYDPSIDLWTATAITTFPSARYGHTAVWSGSEMIVWGGWDGTNYDNAGGRYAPATNSWARMASVPTGRQDHTAVWTGHEMMIWGGRYADTPFNSGGRYTPDNDGWQAMSLNGAPDGRFRHSAVWTGSEMVVWGGAASLTRALNSGGRYQPSVDRWVATDVLKAPEGRSWHSAVWSGNAMLVWGGVSSGYLNDGASYCPLPSPSSFFTVTPCRLFDSRTGPWLVSGVERTIAVSGSCGIPAGASAAALNLTAVGSSGGGSLGAYPTPGQPTGLGIVNFRAGQIRANNTILPLSSSGALTLQALVGQNGVTDAVVDVVGYFQ